MNPRFKGLGDIEGGEVVGLTAPPFGLSTPPLASRKPTSAPPTTDPPPKPTAGESARPKASQPRKATTPGLPATTQPRAAASNAAQKPTAARRRRRGRPTLPPDGSPATRPTNISIPRSTFDLVAAAREAMGLSTGEIIAMAIETQLEALPALIGAQQRPVGMFEIRASRLPRRDDEPQKPIAYRMTSRDLETLDDLVERFGARSRGHLITVALNAYLGTERPTNQ